MKQFNISIRRSVFIILAIIGFLSILSISILWITTELSEHKKRIEKHHESSMNAHRYLLKHEVDRVISYINFSRKQNTHESEEELQQRLLDHMANLHFEHGGYVFINTYDGRALVFDGKKVSEHKDIRDLVDADGLQLFDMEMAAVNKPEGDYMHYRFKRMNSDTYEQKISFIRGYDDWKWIVGAGLYLNDTFKEIAEAEELHIQKLQSRIIKIILLFISLLLLITFMAYLLSVIVNRDFKVFITFFNSSTNTEERIDPDELHVKEFKKLATTANEMLSLRQADSQEIIDQRNTIQKYLDIVGVIVLAINRDGEITLINRKGLEILGYNTNELEGKNWFNTCVPLAKGREMQQRFHQIVKGKANIEENTISPILTKANEIRTIEWSNTIILSHEEEISEVLSSGRDITLQIESEKALIESENKYRLLFEKSSDPVCIFDTNLVFVSCNDAAIQYFAASQIEDLAGRTLESLAIEETNEHSSTILQEKASLGRSLGYSRFEWKHKDLKGELCYSDISLTQIPINGITHIYAIIRDIQLEKQYESELIIAREKAEQISKLKSNFINNMSHEVRTPLNTIMGFSQLLTQQHLTKNDLDLYIKSIMNAGNNLTQIMDDIMDYSRYQTGQLSLIQAPTYLKRIAVETYLKYVKQIENKAINFSFEINISDQAQLVETDGGRIKQVLSKLIDNAIKFTFEGQISFGYSIRNNDIVFQISDTGIGIDKEYTDHIFETFNQINHFSEDRVLGGTGLGLSISKAIIESMGGSIWVTSTPKRGSTFYFKIPHNPIQNPESFFTKLAPKITKKLIGCISNSNDTAQELSRLLLVPALKIEYLDNGPVALENCRFSKGLFAVIVKINEIKTNPIAYIKALAKISPHLLIIAAIDPDTVQSKEELLKAGCHDYVNLPFQPFDINGVIWNLATKKGRQHQ